MTVHHVTIYHNDQSRFAPYETGQRLTAKVSHWLDLDDRIIADDIPEWAWHTFNADIDMLEDHRQDRGGETAFLAACVYRLLGFRSLSVGDVIEVATDGQSQWVACESFGWKAIEPPTNLAGRRLTAETVYEHLTAQRSPR